MSKSGEIVEFPGCEPSREDRDPNELHAEAFRDLEEGVNDLERMGQIANDLICMCEASEGKHRELELAHFAIDLMAKMTREFKDGYHRRWHPELTGPS